MRKKVTVVTMGQSYAESEMHDILSTLSPVCDVEIHGILDEMSEADVEKLAPKGSEMFIVSSLHMGKEVRIAEHNAIRLVNERLIEAD